MTNRSSRQRPNKRDSSQERNDAAAGTSKSQEKIDADSLHNDKAKQSQEKSDANTSQPLEKPDADAGTSPQTNPTSDTNMWQAGATYNISVTTHLHEYILGETVELSKDDVAFSKVQ